MVFGVVWFLLFQLGGTARRPRKFRDPEERRKEVPIVVASMTAKSPYPGAHPGPYPGLNHWLKGASAFPADKLRPTLFTTLLLCGVFWVDLQIPLGVAAGVPYVWVMLSAHWAPGRRVTIAIAILCSILTYLGFLWSPPEGEMWMVVINRLLALFAIWLTTLLCVIRKKREVQLDQTRLMLTENIRLMHSILSGILEGVLVSDRDGKVILSNPSATDLLGRMAGNGWAGRTGQPTAAAPTIDGAIPEPLAAVLKRTIGGERIDAREVAIPATTPGAGELYYRLNGMPMHSPEGQLTGGIVTIHNVTQSRMLEKAIVDATENEQRRIGRDIHDCLIQHLSGILLMLQTITARLTGMAQPTADRAELVAPLHKIQRHLDESLLTARRIAHGLFPVELERFGLVPALEQLLAQLEALHGIAMEGRFAVADAFDMRTIPAESATHLYRIAQEALSNACRHAEARRARLTVAIDADGAIAMTVEDDGRGLPDVESARSGIGLRSMAYRAKQLGGELKYGPSEMGGLKVACRAAGVPASSATQEN
jgi:signal transduction histidine kinase